MPGSDFYLDKNTCSLTALALSLSDLFHFILFPMKIISTWLPKKRQTLIPCSRNVSLTLNCLRIQCQDYTKCNTETNTMAARGHKTYTCHRKPKTGHIPDWKTNEPHMSRNIYDRIYFLMFIFLYAENFRELCPNHTSMT